MKASPKHALKGALRISAVLVPLDFSRLSLSALDVSVAIARAFDARIHFVHVVESDRQLRELGLAPALLEKPMKRRAIEKTIEGIARLHGLQRGEYDCHLQGGRAFAEICALAGEIKADLIVTTTHGYSGLKRVLLGSTAERLVQHAPCPVLVVRPVKRPGSRSKSKSPGFQPKRIIAATDFSSCAAAGEQFAAQFARQFNSRLLLVHAIHPQYYAAGDGYMTVDLPELLAQTEKVARDAMAKVCERLGKELGRKVEASVQTGIAWEEISELAASKRADLIVIATHGWTGLRHIVVGSTAERVVRHAPCAVLVVPSYRREFAK